MREEIPQLRGADEVMLDDIRPFLLDPRENYPEPYFMLEYKGIPFSTIGGIQAISGQKKNGKTFVLAQLMAAILGTGTRRVEEFLPGLRVPERTIVKLGRQPSVLYVDTEMERLNTAKVLRRVHWLCGWEIDQPQERFNVMWLRSITDRKDDDGRVVEKSYDRRYRLIKTAIEALKPDAVFIDGIRDIIGDFNDNAESSRLIGDLMALADEKQICIWNVLHMNPRSSNDDESKMRGHLGTELGNKITDTLTSSKKKDGATGTVTFTVKQQDARGKDMDDWTFEVTDAAGSLGIPKITSNAPMFRSQHERELKEADEYFRTFNWTTYGTTYTDLERHLRMKGVTSNRKIQQLFNMAMEGGIIFKDAKRKYHYNKSKDVPNDETSSIPFEQPNINEKAPY